MLARFPAYVSSITKCFFLLRFLFQLILSWKTLQQIQMGNKFQFALSVRTYWFGLGQGVVVCALTSLGTVMLVLRWLLQVLEQAFSFGGE